MQPQPQPAPVAPSALASPDTRPDPDTDAAPDARATPHTRATPRARETPDFALTPSQSRQVQHMAANVLVESYASGTFPSMNDELLCRRIEYYLDWRPNRLETPQGRMLVSQIRWLVVYHFHAALESASIRYTILGVALEHIRRYLRS